VPPDYVAEFSKLQDSAPPVSYSQIAQVIQSELDSPPEEIFKTFDVQPRASASIGQVHAARLPDDTPVVVKVQRPGVEARVEQDLEILSDLARLATQRTTLGILYDIEGWVEEFAFTLRNELDYTREGQNADRFRRNFASDPTLQIPQVYWRYTTRQVLTLEEIQGIKINDLAALEAAGLDCHSIAKNSARIMLTMVFEHGFFHADPHPGNFFVLPGETIGLIDFGLVGRLDIPLREALLRLVMALIRQDADRLVDELLALGIARGHIQLRELKRDLDHLIQRYYDQSIREIAAIQAFNELMTVALRHKLQLPTDLALLTKVITMSEGLGIQLDPEFKLLEFARPYFQRFWLQSRSPWVQAHRITEGALDLTELGLDLPRRFGRLLGQLERGEITVVNRREEPEEFLRELHRAANRLAMSILTAALIVGLGLLMLVYPPPGWERFGSWLFGLLFGMVMLFGLGLLWAIWRSGRS
ncbi:MAG: AarF/ABC1/UbiB kinase family protein, partial [Nitrospira sp.]|nr:AarF/ABC1/UbiB kinase family protein [Nitrospira sp.]